MRKLLRESSYFIFYGNLLFQGIICNLLHSLASFLIAFNFALRRLEEPGLFLKLNLIVWIFNLEVLDLVLQVGTQFVPVDKFIHRNVNCFFLGLWVGVWLLFLAIYYLFVLFRQYTVGLLFFFFHFFHSLEWAPLRNLSALLNLWGRIRALCLPRCLIWRLLFACTVFYGFKLLLVLIVLVGGFGRISALSRFVLVRLLQSTFIWQDFLCFLGECVLAVIRTLLRQSAIIIFGRSFS